MKKLYSFTVPKEQEVEETQVTRNEKNEEVKTIKKVKKQVPQEFFIRKPSRSHFDDSELFYSVTLSEGIKRGLLTRAQLAVKFTDEAKTFSTAERDEYITNFNKAVELEAEYRGLSLKPEKERTPEEKAKLQTILDGLIEVQRKIQEFENNQQDLFQHTAEVRARNKTILNWVFQLAYFGNETPIFGEGAYQDRIKVYDKMEEDDDSFMLDVVKQFIYLVSFWYMGRAEKKEDFDRLLEASRTANLPNMDAAPKNETKTEAKVEPKAEVKPEAPKAEAPKELVKA